MVSGDGTVNGLGGWGARGQLVADMCVSTPAAVALIEIFPDCVVAEAQHYYLHVACSLTVPTSSLRIFCARGRDHAAFLSEFVATCKDCD